MHKIQSDAPTYDVIGIGAGPFNLGLAALLHPIQQTKAIFFEKNPFFHWHPGMLLDEATLQVPFMADLVTLSDPTSRFSFLSYLHNQKRLYKFYFLENFHISRKEYNHYCQWVAGQLSSVCFSHDVQTVERMDNVLQVTVKNTLTHELSTFSAKHLVLGIGSVPSIPEKLKNYTHEFIQHSANFLDFSKKIKSSDSVCVVGSGQSAAEIVLDLLNEYHLKPRNIIWVTRSQGFFPMEYSKLGLEHFSPEYMQYFYKLPQSLRDTLVPEQNNLYKGISQKTIAAIFDTLYQITVAESPQPLTLIAQSELESIVPMSGKNNPRFELHFFQKQMKMAFQMHSDAIILATGFHPLNPRFLDPLSDILVKSNKQAYALNEDFSIKTHESIPNKLFVQHNSFYSHGVGSPDLGLGCYRNNTIIHAITQAAHYPLHENTVFQTFDPLKIKKDP